ncbi:hypothetical protein G7Y89_g58 [Cudoniella acicularis]|uniref:Uncharacterized protein n=1 Tax=Cudoniella acicularis TaxID=354080 RepID=A0A8H4S0K1_9HELO|nr:hypothetical protein G7Y89_g58 [Cudoniella acicularis]
MGSFTIDDGITIPLPPSYYNYLMSINLDAYEYPYYQKSGAKATFYDIINLLGGCANFLNDFETKNKHLTPIDRPIMEAAYVCFLKYHYKKWDPTSKTGKGGEAAAACALKYKERLLWKACEQVKAWWRKKGLQYPGLKVEDKRNRNDRCMKCRVVDN